MPDDGIGCARCLYWENQAEGSKQAAWRCKQEGERIDRDCSELNAENEELKKKIQELRAQIAEQVTEIEWPMGFSMVSEKQN